MDIHTTTMPAGEAVGSSPRNFYIKQIDAGHSVRIIVRSAAEEQNFVRRGAWRGGLCSTFGDWTAAFFVPWCCPCVSVAQVAIRIGMWPYCATLGVFGVLYLARLVFTAVMLFECAEGSAQSSPFWLAFGLSVGAMFCFGYGVLMMRSRVRALFNIPGSLYGDVVASCLLPCCALSQMASHVKASTRGRSCCGTPDTLPGYGAEL